MVWQKAPFLPMLAGWCALLESWGRGASVGFSFAVGAGAAVVAALAGGALPPPLGWRRVLAAGTVLFALGALLLIFGLRPIEALPDQVEGEGAVRFERPWGARRAIVVDLPEGRFLALVSPLAGVREGDRVRLGGRVTPLEQRDKGFNPERYWRGRGVCGEIRVAEQPETLGRCPGTLAYWRSFLRERILLTLPPLSRGYVLATLIGVDDPDLVSQNKSWGTSHLLAVSGYNVGMLAFLCAKVLPVRGPASLGVTSLLLWGYTLAAGAAASALRAAFMLQLLLLGRILGRPGAMANAVFAGSGLQLLWNPWLFWDVGWRLSVLSVLVLALLAESDLSAERKAALASPLSWAVTAPVCVVTFGVTPVVGVVLNLFAAPAFELLLPAAVVLALPALLGLPGGYFLASLTEGGFRFWAWGADGVAAMLPFQVDEGWLLAGVGALVLGLLLAGHLGMADRRRYILLLALLSATALLLF